MGHRYPVEPRSPLAQSRLTRAARHPERHAVSQRQAGPDMSAAPARATAADELDELAAEAAYQR
jgi:hypothetical protein